MRVVTRILVWLGALLAALVIGLLLLVGIASWRFDAALARTWNFPAVSFRPGLKGHATHGAYLVRVRLGCVECHGTDLAGGVVVEDKIAGSAYGRNITPARLKGWTDGEIARTLRHGVDRHNKTLLIMPADDFTYLGEQETLDVIAYLRSVPAVEKPDRISRLGVLPKVAWLFGKIPQAFAVDAVDHATTFPPQPAPGANETWGRYVYQSTCQSCHKADRTGGPIIGGPPDWPPVANITASALGTWDEAGFIRTLRTGVTPGGATLRLPMIVKYTKHFETRDLKALWAYLSAAPAARAPHADF